MNRNALYFSILAIWIAFCLGWCWGVIWSKRLNTTAIQAYMDAKDFEVSADRLRAVSASAIEVVAANLATAKAEAACVLRIDAMNTQFEMERAQVKMGRLR